MDIELNSNINEYIKTLQAEMDKVVEETATDIYNKSKSTCPVDDGELKNSAYVKGGEVGFTAEYAPYVEAKKHFLYQAFLAGENKLRRWLSGLT